MGERPGEVGRYQRERYPEDQEIVVSEVAVAVVPRDPSDPNQIQSEIAETRAEMSETIDAIQERLNPQHLKEQARDTVREHLTEAKDYMYDATIGRAEQTAKGVKSSMIDTIKQHPVPAAIAGLSLGYLFMQGSSSSSSHQPPRSYSTYSSSSGSMGRQASNMAQQASDKTSQYAHGAMDQASYYADQAQQQAHETTDWFRQKMRSNPLAIGAMAVAVGAAIGLSVPETQTENEWMGEARDSLMQQAKSVGQDVMNKAQHVADEATHTAKQEAKHQGLSS